MSAPTEAEIHAAIMEGIVAWPQDNADKLIEAVEAFADPLRWKPGDVDLIEADYHEMGDTIWRDLRPSECKRLRELLYQAEQRADAAAHDLIVREYTAAALAFAAECPDAPRATRGGATAA
jgi:hypothetical protein